MVAPALLDGLLRRTAEALSARRRLPVSTYRVQFHAGFRFRDAERLTDYLHELGITDCYASPYLKARPGSLHGYDISDHRLLNPEIGSEEDYAAWVEALHARGMGQLLDVVPNHMGIMGNENVWWNDVLENGPASPYAGFFDIDWRSTKPDLHDKVLLPVLGDPYGKALESLQLQLRYEAGTFTIHYFEHRFPVSPCTYGQVLAYRIEELEQELGKDAEAFVEYQSIQTHIARLPCRVAVDPEQIAERSREKEVVKRRLAALTTSSPAVRDFLQRNVELFNGQNGDPRSFDLLDELLNAQAYRLAWWRVAADEINYRRFFDINELAALSMEKEEVFLATHDLILRLLGQGQVNGLRIDHPDGLFDPRQYLERLQQHYLLEVARQVAADDPEYAGLDWSEVEGPLKEAIARTADKDSAPALWRPLYVVVEKILGTGEELPGDWPVHGTTGYEFLNTLNDLFVDKDHAAAFNRLYRRWAQSDTSFRDLLYQNKILTLRVSLSSELHMLSNQLDRLSEKNRWSRDFTLNSLRRALREVIACFEVYRSYITGPDMRSRDRVYVERAVVQAKRRNPAISSSLFDFVRDMLLLEQQQGVDTPRSSGLGPGGQAEQLRFIGKFQQVTAPVMAKGLEDTTFYIYNRLLSLNEVGGDPRQFGCTVDTFHRRNLHRLIRSPHALSATATHDTKRGEDTRARLDVLSEIPREWREAVSRWSRLNRKHRVGLDDETVPDRNEEYFLYQTLVGAWPLSNEALGIGHWALDKSGPMPNAQCPMPNADFVQRIQAYMQKAMHEAKVHTSWINPNPRFDQAIQQFVAAILDEGRGRRFLEDFRSFQARVSHWGLFNSLSQVLLKVASPGVPDVYQGTELWDFSLVDPDNRRPVDYDLRRRLLEELRAIPEEQWPQLCRELTENKEDGRIKLYVLWRALCCRRDYPELFTIGEYLPAHADGEHDDNLCAFARRHEGRWALAVVPRLLTRLLPSGTSGELPLGRTAWKDAMLLVPGIGLGRSCRNVFTGEVLTTTGLDGQACLPLAQVFAHFPVALFLAAE